MKPNLLAYEIMNALVSGAFFLVADRNALMKKIEDEKNVT